MSKTENKDKNPAEQAEEAEEIVQPVTPESEELEAVADEQVASDEQQSQNDELAEAHLEIAKLKDAFLRAKAEQDNVRRRSEKEVANSRKFAVEGFAKELLSVYDSLKLALSAELAEDASEGLKSLRDGVEITLRQLQSALGKFGVEEIMPQAGDKLDPNLHQAMSLVESDEVESGAIINVAQSGFKLHDRLLRAAMVIVAK